MRPRGNCQTSPISRRNVIGKPIAPHQFGHRAYNQPAANVIFKRMRNAPRRRDLAAVNVMVRWPMSSEGNKALVLSFFQDVINAHNAGAAAGLLAPDYVEHAAPGLAPGLTGFQQFSGMITAAFPDLHVTVEDMIAEGDLVAARLTVRGTQMGSLQGLAPTGKRAAWSAIHVFRVVGDRLAERWSVADALGRLEQLGLLRRA